jgi:hypothetical protein
MHKRLGVVGRSWLEGPSQSYAVTHTTDITDKTISPGDSQEPQGSKYRSGNKYSVLKFRMGTSESSFQ